MLGLLVQASHCTPGSIAMPSLFPHRFANLWDSSQQSNWQMEALRQTTPSHGRLQWLSSIAQHGRKERSNTSSVYDFPIRFVK